MLYYETGLQTKVKFVLNLRTICQLYCDQNLTAVDIRVHYIDLQIILNIKPYKGATFESIWPCSMFGLLSMSTA